MIILMMLLALLGIGSLVLFYFLWMVRVKFRNLKSKEAKLLELEAELLAKESSQKAELAKILNDKASLEARSKDLAIRLNNVLEKEATLKLRDANLAKIKASLFRKSEALNAKEAAIEVRNKDLIIKEASLEHLAVEYKARVERAAELSLAEARSIVLESAKKETERDMAVFLRDSKEEVQKIADFEAQKLLTLAIERVSVSQAPLRLTSQVVITDENFRGKLIGHEGKNIKLLEELTGVQILTNNEDLKILTVSAFNPISRELCRRIIEELAAINFVNPKKIKEVYDKHSHELEREILKTGRDTFRSLGLSMPHTEIAKLLGKLKYRTSYGQSVLNHSIEVAQLCGALAGELKLDVKLAKRAGLLPDIGKAIDIEKEGTHPELGGIAARRYGEHEVVVNAIESHHDDIEVINLISILVAVCDGISGSRPGARRNNLADYVKRIETLESVALTFPGVIQAMALQSGRDLRVVVNTDLIDDVAAVQLSSALSKQIHDQMDYPGRIKVTVIREKKAVAIAG
jgi:ribonuclease Y